MEQDLIICRALCDIFNDDALRGKIAFRGGTAINKLLFRKPLRYSEDIDLIQVEAGGIGPVVNAIRDALLWLGKFSYHHAEHSMHLTYSFAPEADPASKLKLKVEINTREHEPLYGIKQFPFEIVNSWYSAEASIASFQAEEMFGTKLRAMLQRNKNRDLFDLYEGLLQLSMDPDKIVACFEHYLGLQGLTITRANAEEIMLRKLNRSLTEDIAPLLPRSITYENDDAVRAFNLVWNQLIARIKGEPWRASERTIEQIRVRIPNLLAENDAASA